jgi:hypothetical protein
MKDESRHDVSLERHGIRKGLYVTIYSFILQIPLQRVKPPGRGDGRGRHLVSCLIRIVIYGRHAC